MNCPKCSHELDINSYPFSDGTAFRIVIACRYCKEAYTINLTLIGRTFQNSPERSYSIASFKDPK